MNQYEIGPERKFSFGLAELWRSREMCLFFAWRDLRVRYKQTVLGVAWAIIQPLLMMIAFTFLIGRFQQPGQTVPYMIYAFSGISLYNFFSSGFSTAGNSMVSNAAIIRKIYFPRLIIPFSSVIVSFVDFLFTIPMLAALMVWKGVHPHWELLICVIPGLFLTFITTCGAGILVSALNIQFRDFRYIIPFAAQFLLFATTAVYPPGIISTGWVKTLFSINPLTAAIECYRSFITGTMPDSSVILPGLLTSLLLFLLGLFYFKRTERSFADII